MSKSWFQSKLVWLGILQTVIGVLGIVADFLGAGNYTPQAVTILVMGALTVGLRIWFTDTPIS